LVASSTKAGRGRREMDRLASSDGWFGDELRARRSNRSWEDDTVYEQVGEG
jgi:hypothetical protein